MKYLTLFDTQTEYEAYMTGGEVALPNVSLVEENMSLGYAPYVPHDYTQDYFTTVVTVGGDITWKGKANKFSGAPNTNKLSYSTDNGATWSTPSYDIILTVEAGDKVLWKGETTPVADVDYMIFGIGIFSGNTDVRYSVEGNVMSLLFGDNFKGQISLNSKKYAFNGLFAGNKNITSAKNLSLPATTLAQQCYYYMFQGCTNLTTAPELPATTLVNECYYMMFHNCTSLTTAPELPATTLAESCYYAMFGGCTSLTTVPELPATTVANSCYSYMFDNCTNLITASELPATTLAENCYYAMFGGCRSLTTAPSVLPATTLAQGCYQYMFSGCTSLTSAPELPATTLTQSCYQRMFQGCTSLNSIKCLATNISANNCIADWVKSVATSGTFIKAASMTGWETGTSGIPSGWTVVDA